jgi:hypothetical protein
MTNSFQNFNDKSDITGRSKRGGIKRRGSFLTRQREKLKQQRGESEQEELTLTRMETLLSNLAVNMDSRYYMNELIEVLSKEDNIHVPEIKSYPVPGETYTFIYEARTPGLLYDYHPVTTVLDFIENGFIGYNMHLGSIRRYRADDGRVKTRFYRIYDDEIESVLQVPSEFLRISYG